LNEFGQALPTQEGGPVTLTDEFLISPRDNKPIVIRYGLDLSQESAGSEPILAYEQDGYHGRRFVVYARTGNVEEIDEAQFGDFMKPE
jgi:hypothetical protein